MRSSKTASAVSLVIALTTSLVFCAGVCVPGADAGGPPLGAPPGAPPAVEKVPGPPPSNGIHGYDAFYDAPVDPAKLTSPGHLLREQDAPQLLNLLNDSSLPGHARKILYTSTTVHGDVVPVSGFVIEPARPWQGQGPTPTVVFGLSTRGSGDACAPSRGPLMLGEIDPDSRALDVNYERHTYHAASMMGMRVVVSDLIGLGTPGAHTYVLHEEEAHALLDAARAVVPEGHPIGFWGYSQGGGASAAAAEFAQSYAPELNVKGTYTGGPPADLVATLRGVDNSAILAVLGYALAGMTERYPHLQPVADEKLNERGQYFVQTTENSCLIDGTLRWGLRDSRTLTTTGQTLSDALLSADEVLEVLDSQKLGRRAPHAPILVATGGSDDIVPSEQVVQLARDYCTKGAPVFFHSDNLPPLGPRLGIDHTVPMLLQNYPSLRWLVDRFNNVPTGSNCGGF